MFSKQWKKHILSVINQSMKNANLLLCISVFKSIKRKLIAINIHLKKLLGF